MLLAYKYLPFQIQNISHSLFLKQYKPFQSKQLSFPLNFSVFKSLKSIKMNCISLHPGFTIYQVQDLPGDQEINWAEKFSSPLKHILLMDTLPIYKLNKEDKENRIPCKGEILESMIKLLISLELIAKLKPDC